MHGPQHPRSAAAVDHRGLATGCALLAEVELAQQPVQRAAPGLAQRARHSQRPRRTQVEIARRTAEDLQAATAGVEHQRIGRERIEQHGVQFAQAGVDARVEAEEGRRLRQPAAAGAPPPQARDRIEHFEALRIGFAARPLQRQQPALAQRVMEHAQLRGGSGEAAVVELQAHEVEARERRRVQHAVRTEHDALAQPGLRAQQLAVADEAVIDVGRRQPGAGFQRLARIARLARLIQHLGIAVGREQPEAHRPAIGVLQAGEQDAELVGRLAAPAGRHPEAQLGLADLHRLRARGEMAQQRRALRGPDRPQPLQRRQAPGEVQALGAVIEQVQAVVDQRPAAGDLGRPAQQLDRAGIGLDAAQVGERTEQRQQRRGHRRIGILRRRALEAADRQRVDAQRQRARRALATGDAGVAGRDRHLRITGAGLALDEHAAAGIGDGPRPARAVRTGAGEHDADRARAEVAGEGLEQPVDARRRRGAAGLLGQPEAAVLADRDPPSRRQHVDEAGLRLQAVDQIETGLRRALPEDRGDLAAMTRREMLRDDEAGHAVAPVDRQRPEEGLQRPEPAGRGPECDDRKAPVIVHRSLALVIHGSLPGWPAAGRLRQPRTGPAVLHDPGKRTSSMVASAAGSADPPRCASSGAAARSCRAAGCADSPRRARRHRRC